MFTVPTDTTDTLALSVDYLEFAQKGNTIFFHDQRFTHSSITSTRTEVSTTYTFPDLGTMSGDTILQKVKKSKKVQSKEKAVDPEDATTVIVNELPIEDISESL